MLFSVIFSVYCPRSESIARFRPPQHRTLWQLTECDESYDYGYLEGEWLKGKHRKWCGLLTKEQFTDFVDHTCMFAEDVETMGSIGAPGFGYSLAPAISFRDDGEDRAIRNAYVTPVPETKKDGFDERDWRRVRQAVLNVYGYN